MGHVAHDNPVHRNHTHTHTFTSTSITIKHHFNKQNFWCVANFIIIHSIVHKNLHKASPWQCGLADSKIVLKLNLVIQSTSVVRSDMRRQMDSLPQPAQTISPTIHYTSNHLKIWWLWQAWFESSLGNQFKTSNWKHVCGRWFSPSHH